MKPCSSYQKQIAFLAVGTLKDQEERLLHAHIENCEGCRGYFREMVHLTQKLSAAAEREPSRTVSDMFHRNLVRRMNDENRVSGWESFVAFFRVSERMLFPAIGAAALVIALIWSVGSRRSPAPSQLEAKAPKIVVPMTKTDLDPTISNYRMVANRSLDTLDELLSRQETRNPSPTRVYTAAALSRADIAE